MIIGGGGVSVYGGTVGELNFMQKKAKILFLDLGNFSWSETITFEILIVVHWCLPTAVLAKIEDSILQTNEWSICTISSTRDEL